MKKKTLIVLGIIVLLGVGIGVKWYMDKEKDKKELVEIQTDLANYLYNNYDLFRENQAKKEQLSKEYNSGQGSLTTKEYLEKGLKIRDYSDIKKIEFTKFYITEMNAVAVSFSINDVYKDDIILDTISAETNKGIYKVDALNEVNSYYLERKNEPTDIIMPADKIVYYKGGID